MGYCIQHFMLFLVHMVLLTGYGHCKTLCPKITRSEIDESKYTMDAFRTGDIEDTKSFGRRTYLHGKRTCPRKLDSDFKPCPSYFEMNFDPNRKPTTIVEVICSCQLCLAKQGLQLVNSTRACVPIYYYRDVLEKDSNECFSLKTRRFKVGCECIGDEKHSIIKPTSSE